MLRRAVATIALSPLLGCPAGPSSDVARADVHEPRSAGGEAPASEEDADADGVTGTDDDCPSEQEDRDAYQDHDGCPDPDHDVQYVIDECEADRDHDMISDAADRCPEVAETYDAVEDDDGCPDASASIVVREDMALIVDPPIAFDYDHASLRPTSLRSIDALASFLAHHPAIHRLEIQGHLGEEHHGGSRLDRDRAESVAEALVARGVARERLEPRGYRFTRPLPDADREHPDRRNWRIVFVILDERPCSDP